MKKIISLFLTAAMLTPILASCGKAPADSDGASSGAVNESVADDPDLGASSDDVTGEDPETPSGGADDGADDGAFVHPGVLSTAADLERISAAVKNGESPFLESWETLRKSEFSHPASPRATETVIRGGEGDNIGLLYRDVTRAYQCALIWRIGGDGYEEYADGACEILNAWSSTLSTVGGNADRYLASGLYGYQLAAASELMRDYPGFDVQAMQKMLIDVFYKPLCERFLISNEYGSDHNDACITNYWANWDLCNMAATLAIGVFCDRRDIYDIGIDYFRYGKGNGSIYNAIPHLFDGLAQWQEAGRDQGHANLGIGLMATCCEIAYNQGDDLYGWADNRFMYAAEYVARYNNGDDVPFELYEWATGQKGDWKSQTAVSDATRGQMRPIWAMIYNHYHCRMGYEMPNVEKRLALEGVEGGPGGHPSSFDQPGFGTLLYTRPEGSGSTAKQLDGNIEDGIYKFSARHSGLYLTYNGKMVCQSADGAPGQAWRVTHLGGGQYKIENVDFGLCLMVRGGSYDPSAPLSLGGYDGQPWQKFAFLPASDGFYRITAVHSSKALDVHNASKDNGTDIIQYRYMSGAHQMWLPVRIEG